MHKTSAVLKTLVLFQLHHGHVRKYTRLSTPGYVHIPEHGSLGMRPDTDNN